jgi:hypothetical protein
MPDAAVDHHAATEASVLAHYETTARAYLQRLKKGLVIALFQLRVVQ